MFLHLDNKTPNKNEKFHSTAQHSAVQHSTAGKLNLD